MIGINTLLLLPRCWECVRYQVLQLGHSEPMQWHRLSSTEAWLERCLEEKDIRGACQQHLNMSRPVVSTDALNPTFTSGALHNEKDAVVLEHNHRRAMELLKDLEHKSHEE